MARRFDRDSKYNSIGRSNVGSDVFEFMDTNSTNTCDNWNCGPKESADNSPENKNDIDATVAPTDKINVVPHDLNILEIDVYDSELIDTPCDCPVIEKD